MPVWPLIRSIVLPIPSRFTISMALCANSGFFSAIDASPTTPLPLPCKDMVSVPALISELELHTKTSLSWHTGAGTSSVTMFPLLVNICFILHLSLPKSLFRTLCDHSYFLYQRHPTGSNTRNELSRHFCSLRVFNNWRFYFRAIAIRYPSLFNRQF